MGSVYSTADVVVVVFATQLIGTNQPDTALPKHHPFRSDQVLVGTEAETDHDRRQWPNVLRGGRCHGRDYVTMNVRLTEKAVDSRTAMFRSGDPLALQAAADDWPLSPRTPELVLARLVKARRQFLNADIDYDNFVTAAATTLRAVEDVLRLALHLDKDSRRTFGGLIKDADTAGLLDSEQRDVLDVSLRFRNRIIHGEEVALTPAMSDSMIHALHRLIHELVERHFSNHGANHLSGDGTDEHSVSARSRCGGGTERGIG
jgi:hypothetical protein